MDIQKIPPIQQKRIVAFVNHFIVETVTFLNKFICSVEATLWRHEKKLRKLDVTLKLLENKLNSVSDLNDENTPPQVDNQLVNRDDLVKETDNAKELDTEEDNVCTQNPELERFKKMLQFGVPSDAVKLKMQQEGIDPNLLKV